MDAKAQELLNNASLKVVYFAVLLLLVVLMVYHSKTKEHASSYSLAESDISKGANSGGPGLRLYGTVLSSTNQQPYEGVYNAQANAVEATLNPTKEHEMLVNMGGYPDFWEISGELGDYKSDESAAYKKQGPVKYQPAQSAGGEGENTERFGGSDVSSLYIDALGQHFYPGASTGY